MADNEMNTWGKRVDGIRSPPKNGGEQSYRPPKNGGEQSCRPPENGGEQSCRPPKNGGEQSCRPPKNGGEQSCRPPKNGDPVKLSIGYHERKKEEDRKPLFLQYYIQLNELEKDRKLEDLLDALDFNQVLIFVKSVNRAEEVNNLLVECRYPSTCIHSGMSQEERLSRYTTFKAGFQRVMVATHVLAIDIDSERVNIAINYDMPDSADAYLDTAAARGGKGVAISLVSSSSDSKLLLEIQKRTLIKHLPQMVNPELYM